MSIGNTGEKTESSGIVVEIAGNSLWLQHITRFALSNKELMHISYLGLDFGFA